MAGIVEVVMDTPCAVCRRLARYTLFHRADELLLARFREPVHHSDVHLIVWELERLHATAHPQEAVEVVGADPGAALRTPPARGIRRQEARVDYGVIDALMGWSTEERRTIMRERYGDKDTPFAKLIEGIESLSYPWLPIPRPATNSPHKADMVVAE